MTGDGFLDIVPVPNFIHVSNSYIVFPFISNKLPAISILYTLYSDTKFINKACLPSCITLPNPNDL